MQSVYSWLADGTKAGVKNADNTSGYEYAGSLVYKRVGGELRLESADFGGGLILVSEGSAGTVYTPAYYITDHLGSTRSIYDGSETIARSDFLPFGTRWDNGQAATSRYQFTGYEDQELIDRRYMDAGARFYNRLVFNTQDPFSEMFYGHTPYNFTLNNPVNFIDRYGLAPEKVPGGTFDVETLSGTINSVACYGSSRNGLTDFEKMVFLSLQEKYKSVEPESDEEILERIYALNPMARVVHNAQNTVVEHPISQTILGAAYGMAIGGLVTNLVKPLMPVVTTTKGTVKGATKLSKSLRKELQPTLKRIKSGGKFPHKNDGTVFKNSEGLLPQQNHGYYKEFVHPTPEVKGAGVQRIVTGQRGEIFFTPDHYQTFIRIK